MLATETAYVTLGGSLIELLAAVVICLHVALALFRIVTGQGSDVARLIIARGVLGALSFSIAGTLLKTIALQSWPQIRMFAFVLLLRTLLKRVFQWEQRKIEQRSALSRVPAAVRATAALLLAGVALLPRSAQAATGTHLPQSTLYPRIIRLNYAPHALQGSLLAKTSNRLFRSIDEGRTFTFLTTVPTVNFEQGSPGAGKDDPNRERCCSTIFELPRKLGRFRPGTLLYSGSFFSGGIPAVEIYTSTDQGAHWKYLSTPMKSGDDHHGLWEPAFTIAKDGSLVMFVSDETDPCCSQKLVQMRTRDLVAWTSKRDTVAGRAQPDRPGMAIVSPLPDGTYLMSYEICGPTTHCQVYTRISHDGWDFGDPADFGTRAVSTAGQYLAHAPTNIYDPVAKQIVLSGQVLYANDGTVSPRNGQILFTNKHLDGSGRWQTIDAPVQIPTAYDNYCPNYSSALMPTTTGLLELASDYEAPHHCTSFFASLPTP